MSDQELVSFNPAQFARIDMNMQALGNALWAINEQLKRRDSEKLDAIIDMLSSAAGVPATLGFVKEELSLIHGLVANGPEAINNLTGKVEEFMSTQEERLRGVKVKLDAIQAGVDKIQEQLAALKVSNPELEDEISAIEATAAAIDTDVNPVEPEPPTEPPTEPSGRGR